MKALIFLAMAALTNNVSAQATYPLPEIYLEANQRDPMRYLLPRARIAGGYQSPSGIQLHARCIEQAAQTHWKRQLVEQAFEKLIRSALETMLVSCTARYPELAPYIAEWVMQFRRTVITCSNKTRDDLGFGAENIYFPSSLSDDERKGFTDLELDRKDDRASLPDARRTVVRLARDTFLRILVAGFIPTGPVHTRNAALLIHEVLHSTGANNRKTHNVIEGIAPGERWACGPDVSMDRVNLIAALCTNTLLHGSKDPTPVVIARHMDRCGPALGCGSVFSNKDAWHEGWNLPSRGLPKDAARALCERIYAEGHQTEHEDEETCR